MPIKHSLQTAIHKPYAAVYTDATERLAATGFIRAEGGGIVPFDATDLYKIVLQLSNASEWVLTAITPTWEQVGGSGLAPANHAASHQNGGGDEISVAGLSGVLADPQTPITEAVQDIVAALLVAGTNVTITYNDGAGTLTIDSTGGGGGGTNPTSTVIPYNNAGTFADSPMAREDANTVIQRNSTTAQKRRIYISDNGSGTYSRITEGLSILGGSNWDMVHEVGGGASGVPFSWAPNAGAGRMLYDGAQIYPAVNNTQNCGTGTNRWAQVRAVDLWAQTRLIFENGSTISDVGASFGGVIKFGSLTTGDGTWSGGEVSPGTIGSNQNDYNPATIANFQRWSASTPVNITGMTRFQQAGQMHLIVNVGANAITLKHQDGASAAANRFLCSTGADVVLNQDQAADLTYDSTTQRWRVFKRN